MSPLEGKTVLCFQTYWNKHKEGCARGTTRYFFHSFPSCGAPVLQSHRSPKEYGKTTNPLSWVGPPKSPYLKLGPKTRKKWPGTSIYVMASWSTCFDPRPPELHQWKKLNLVHRGKCRGFFVKFFAPILPGNWRTKICEKFRQNFAAFFADLFEKFRKNFALGDCGHNGWRQIWRVAGRESGSPELLGSPRTSPEVPRTSPEVFRRLPGSSFTVELNSNPEVPRK